MLGRAWAWRSEDAAFHHSLPVTNLPHLRQLMQLPFLMLPATMRAHIYAYIPASGGTLKTHFVPSHSTSFALTRTCFVSPPLPLPRTYKNPHLQPDCATPQASISEIGGPAWEHVLINLLLDFVNLV